MFTTSQLTRLATSATVLSTFGLLAAPIPALADPVCKNFGWPGAVTITEEGGGSTYSFTSTGPTATGPATAMGLRAMVTGGITGRQIALKFTFDKDQTPPGGYQAWELGGEVSSDNIGRGSSFSQQKWSTSTPLTCLDAAADPPEGGGAPAPAGMAKVLGDVDMYDAPGGNGNQYPGFLDDKNGTATVKLITCQDDDWCKVDAPGVGPVWVWGEFIEH